MQYNKEITRPSVLYAVKKINNDNVNNNKDCTINANFNGRSVLAQSKR